MITKSLFTFMLGVVSASTAFGQTYPLSDNYWSSPEFQDRVMGSYGINSSIEPKLTEEEGTLFKELMIILDSDLQRGRSHLASSISSESSAALDFTLGTIDLQLGNLGDAVENYKKAIKKFPNFMRAYKSAGYALAQAERFDEAPKFLVKGLELGGGDGTTYGLLGFCYLNQEKFGAALNAYNLAMAFEPDVKDWQLGKIRCLLQMQGYVEAQALIEDLIVRDPDNAELWMHHANTKLAMDAASEAATNLEIVRRMGRSTVSSLTLLGDIYGNQEMHNHALDVYREVLNSENGYDAVGKAKRMVRSMLRHKAYDEASALNVMLIDLFQSSLSKEERIEILNLSAEIELAQNNTEEAAEVLAKIVEEDPMNGQALVLLARHAWTIGNFEEAAFLYERAAKVDEVSAKALLQHGQMLVQQKSYKEAARLIRGSLDLRFSPQVADYLRDVEEASRMLQ